MIYNKLVRDKIPEIIAAGGKTAVCHPLSPPDYTQALHAKLQEEVDEFIKSEEVDELADILEVVYAIAQSKGLQQAELEQLRLEKQEARGGFTQRIWLESVE